MVTKPATLAAIERGSAIFSTSCMARVVEEYIRCRNWPKTEVRIECSATMDPQGYGRAVSRPPRVPPVITARVARVRTYIVEPG